MANDEQTSAHLLARLSSNLNASEAAVRLLLSILLGFPIALFHRYTLYGRNPTWQHLFFVISGLSIGYWNYDTNILHSTVTLCITYLLFKLHRQGSSTCVVVNFVFNMLYLFYGYYTTSTEDYDIKWTMPQCVLTLRLIGLGFNLWDGQKPEEKLSVYQRQVALKTQPSFLEIAAFVYFPGSFLVGPQFSMKRYLDYVNGRLIEQGSKNELPKCLGEALFRAFLGFTYVALFQLGTLYVSDAYLLDEKFAELNFFKRLLLIGFWGHANLYKYISCWLLTDAVCTTFGLTYNGKDEKGQILWNGCENVRLTTFENATQFNHYILSFNINTNNWCAEYIYKRLRFLGSRFYSQFITLLFLAVWHGFHSGYYNCFFLEFLIMYFERDICKILQGNQAFQESLKTRREVSWLFWLISKFYTIVFMGYCLISFVYLSYPRYHKVYSSVYYCGHIIFLSYPLLAPIVKRLMRDPAKNKASHD